MEKKVSVIIPAYNAETASFTEHPADRVKVLHTVCDSIDRFYPAPALSRLTQKKPSGGDRPRRSEGRRGRGYIITKAADR